MTNYCGYMGKVLLLDLSTKKVSNYVWTDLAREKYIGGKAMASNPRTALGVVDGLHYVFVTADGRTGQSEGLSLYELAAFLRDLGVRTAYNLDGGGSSTMVFQGEIINHPTTSGNSVKERSVSDIVYIGP